MTTPDEAVTRARTLIQLGRPEQAERELRGALAREPQHAASHALLALALVSQGHGRAPEAVSEALESVRLAPQWWFAHYVTAQVLMRAGRLQEAQRAVETVLSQQPEYAPAWELLGRVMLKQGRWREAERAARQGQALDPEDADVALVLAVALEGAGDRAAAREAAGRAIARPPARRQGGRSRSIPRTRTRTWCWDAPRWP
ncbi:tetratricopeptide repeat protein [Nonomuraea sp. NPDC050663]|uniref:tetratricopeptide repeat protein n=1 Tax=Nonomuraea sp. NPDC050663 TaxID=3364370 RepID=UPI0037B35C42